VNTATLVATGIKGFLKSGGANLYALDPPIVDPQTGREHTHCLVVLYPAFGNHSLPEAMLYGARETGAVAGHPVQIQGTEKLTLKALVRYSHPYDLSDAGVMWLAGYHIVDPS
jgi:hypothetical protein